MKAQNSQPTAAAAAAAATEMTYSCGRREKKNEETSFFQDLKDQFDDFIHTPMDQHFSCFKNTINKMFGMSKIDGVKSGTDDAKVSNS